MTITISSNDTSGIVRRPATGPDSRDNSRKAQVHARRDAALFGDRRRSPDDFADDCIIAALQIVQGGDVFLGNDQHVR